MSDFDSTYWKDVISILDETFDAARVGMKKAMDTALIDMRSKLKLRNSQITTSTSSLDSDKMQNAEKEVRPSGRGGDG
jgi:hypothetical protein